MTGALALPLALAAAIAPYHAEVRPLSEPVRAQIRAVGAYRQGCPVRLSQLRLLSVSYRGFDGQAHTGRLVVNRSVAAPLGRVFRKLYELRFPIRHMTFADGYGPEPSRPADGDVSGAFSCRQAVPSPCVGGRGTGTWSNHAFGLAVDLNPIENPYVGCGESHDPAAARFRDRSIRRRGMITRSVIAAFRSIGWGWGGNWTGTTKDYTHFSVSGH